MSDSASRQTVSAALLIIGDEILSGRTQDKNIAIIADALNMQGIQLREVRIVPDVEARIADAVNALRAEYSYLFTTGGIGPTHDDITAQSIAKAFGTELELNADALALMEAYYGARGEKVTEARQRMAMMPKGAQLIRNGVSGAPGIRMENVFVMAGVPGIMQNMLSHVLPLLEGGQAMLNVEIPCDHPESVIAGPLGKIAQNNPDVSIGSYPHFHEKWRTNLVIRGTDPDRVGSVSETVEAMISDLG